MILYVLLFIWSYIYFILRIKGWFRSFEVWWCDVNMSIEYINYSRQSGDQLTDLPPLPPWPLPLYMSVKRRMLHKGINIKNNTAHLLHNIVLKQWSVIRLRFFQLWCNTEQYRRFFLPAAITLHNQSLWWLLKKILQQYNFHLGSINYFLI